MAAGKLPANRPGIREDICIVYGFDKEEVARIQRRKEVMAAQGYMTDFPLGILGANNPKYRGNWHRKTKNISDSTLHQTASDVLRQENNIGI